MSTVTIGNFENKKFILFHAKMVLTQICNADLEHEQSFLSNSVALKVSINFIQVRSNSVESSSGETRPQEVPQFEFLDSPLMLNQHDLDSYVPVDGYGKRCTYCTLPFR